MEQWKRTVLPLITLFTTVMFDGIITALFREQLNTSWGLVTPRITLLALIILAFYLNHGHLIVLALLFGFIYDSYYTGYLGIYMASFALIVYIILQLRGIFHVNVFIYVLLSVIMLTILEFFLFGVYRVLGVTTLSVQAFLAERLGATLLFNGGLMIILSYPFDKFMQFVVKSEEKKYRQKY